MPAPEIAVAYVSIVPEIQGFARELRRQIVAPATDAGERAGSAFSRALSRQDAGSALVSIVSTAGIAARAQAVSAGAAVGAAFANSFAAAGAGAGALVAAVKPQLDKVTTATEAYTDASEKKAYADFLANKAQKLAAKGGDTYKLALKEAGKAAKKASEAQDKYKFSLSEMPKATRDTASSVIKLKGAFEDWSDELAPTTMPMFTQAIDTVRRALPALNPIAKTSAQVLSDFFTTIGDGGASGVFSTFADNIRNNAGSALSSFLQIGKNVATGFVGIINAFAPMQVTMTSGLEDISRRFALFGAGLKDSGGFKKFLADVRASLPGIREALANLLITVGNLAKAFAGLGPAAFSVLGVLLRLAAALPVRVLQGLIIAYTAWKVSIIATNVVLAAHALFLNRATLAAVRHRLAQLGAALAMGAVRVAVGLLTVAFLAQTAAQRVAAFATNLVTAANIRQRLASLGSAAAMLAVRAAVLVTTVAMYAQAAAMRVVNLVMRANPIGLVITALVALGAGLVWAYKKSETFRSIVQGAWKGIQIAALFAWRNVLRPTFLALGHVMRWLYENVAKPVFRHIMAAIRIFWVGLRMHFNMAKAAIRTLGAVAKWLYYNIIQPVFRGIAGTAKWLWTSGLKPAFNAVKAGVRAVGNAFNTAKNYIGKQWSKLSAIAKKPISFIVNTVYNKGIVGVWNKVAGAFGAPKLKTFRFATGGILPGYTPGRDVHLAALSGGEAVMRPEWTRAVGPGYVNTMNAAARSGGVSGVRKMTEGMGLPAFKDGGIFDWVSKGGAWLKGVGSSAWEKVKAGATWLKDTIAASAKAGLNSVVRPLINSIPGANTGFGKMVRGIPRKMIESALSFGKKADDKMMTAIPAGIPGGSGVKRWAPLVLQALRMLGQPASYLGITLRRMNQESGGNARAINRWDINAKNGVASRGLMQVIPPTFNAYAGKLRGRGIWDPLANIYASMRYALGRYGSLPRAYNRAGGYDSGGWLQPGSTMAVNKTGKPEPILNPSQWAAVSTLANRGAQGGLQPGDRLVLMTGRGMEFEAYVDRRADERISAELTTPATLGRTM